MVDDSILKANKRKQAEAKTFGKQPTELQMKTMKERIANPTKPLGKCMLDAGYSVASANDPNRHLLTTGGWKTLTLVKKYMPDEYLARIHRKLLEKRESAIVGGRYIYGEQPHADVKGALDMAYKLNGKYVGEKKDVTHTLKLSEDQLLRIVNYRKVDKDNAIDGEVIENITTD